MMDVELSVVFVNSNPIAPMISFAHPITAFRPAQIRNVAMTAVEGVVVLAGKTSRVTSQPTSA